MTHLLKKCQFFPTFVNKGILYLKFQPSHCYDKYNKKPRARGVNSYLGCNWGWISGLFYFLVGTVSGWTFLERGQAEADINTSKQLNSVWGRGEGSDGGIGALFATNQGGDKIKL